MWATVWMPFRLVSGLRRGPGHLLSAWSFKELMSRDDLLLPKELPEEWCCRAAEILHRTHVVIKDMMHVYSRCSDMVGKWGQQKTKDFVGFLCF